MLTWDAKTFRYRNARGQFVARVEVVQTREAVIKEASNQMDALTQQLRDRAISLADWQLGMRDVIRAGHTLVTGIACGGKNNASASDWGRLGATLREQYKYLQRFAIAIENGQPVSLQRVRMYAQALRQTFHNAEKAKRKDAGVLRARWVTTARESCEGCLTQERLGVRELSAIPPLGSQQCLTHCRCHLIYE